VSSLASRTDRAWAERVLAGLDELLLDHAHCEKKAAGVAVKLLFAYPQHEFLLAPLAALAREELVHFEAVLGLLRERGQPFRRLRPAPYAGRLRTLARPAEPQRGIDLLLCSALIEARSCERFELLAGAVAEPRLAGFYRGLLAAEARHHRIYVELAAELGGRGPVRERLRQLARAEAAILAEAPPWIRMHA
jgi:tRNA-(ms[2]io[6]A)-hydroxylase